MGLVPPLALILLFACTSDDSKESIENGLDRIEITDFKILDNTKDGITLETRVYVESDDNIEITDHGVYLLKDEDYFDKVSLGGLEELIFTTTVGSGLTKGESYSVFPYIFAKNTFFYGDTLDFDSRAEIDFEILEITPLRGFVNDTIMVAGRSLCLGTETNKNTLFLEENPQTMLFESDSLLKFLIEPNIRNYKNKIFLESCGIKREYEGVFEIIPFEIDSLHPKEAFVTEEVALYGDFFEDKVTEIWINDTQVDIQDFSSSKTKLVFNVPEGLPSGNLDFTFKMLDSTIIKEGFFQSTTPYVDSIDKTATGFLDTLTVKGNYFIQPNNGISIKIGDEEHHTYTATKEEIKIVLDRYFEVDNPTLELTIGDFEYTRGLRMLPPEILFIEEKDYHINESSLLFKTKYFLPTLDNLTIGGLVVDYPSPGVPDVAPDGTIIVDPSKWLIRYYEKFQFDENGQIPIEIKTYYGEDKKAYRVLPPTIDSVEPSSFFAGEEFEINGIDLGHEEVATVFLDGQPLDNDEISLWNNGVLFSNTADYTVGVHQIKIRTGSQESNPISFEILPIEADPFGNLSGTRLDIFTVMGNNLDRGYYYFSANGEEMDIMNGLNTVSQSRLSDRASIRFRFDQLLTESSQTIAFHYAGERKELGTINAIEPFAVIEDYQMLDQYDAYNTNYNAHFEYNNRLYLLNFGGIYEFDLSTRNWSVYEEDMPQLPFGIARYQPSIDGDKLYLIYDMGFQVYDMVGKTWSRIDFELDDSVSVTRGVVLGGTAYLVSSSNQFIRYDLGDKSTIIEELPTRFRVSSDELIKINDGIYIDLAYENIFKYDLGSGNWTDLGKPSGKYGYDGNLYEYNGILYYSGGREGEIFYGFSSFDPNIGRWTEKVPLPIRVYNHAVIGSGQYLYFLLGGRKFGGIHTGLFQYNIDLDPN